MWRRTEGCDNPQSAGRLPGGDLSCDQAPSIYASGSCECKDDIPRYFKCGANKKTCQQVCAKPPPRSHLPAAFASPHSKKHDKVSGTGHKAGSWWRTNLPTLVVVVAMLVVLFVHHFTLAPQNVRQDFTDLLKEQQREIAFERSLHD